MANNTSTFTLRLRTQGMDQAQQQSQAIANNMQAAQQAANQLGGSATSRRMASSAAAQPTGTAGASAGVVTGQQVQNYNVSRGAAGASGGTARDFADQARGLGGLVRLYATVAANTFALTSAFNALSRAMDTTNMVKGLDQLGAASGVALGSLSKRLVDATDGAISLREAMEATTKAVSSGMNSQDVLRLGNVAKQASQALGVDMGDAISRLTRGITKLEPELLDELGIFTKLDPAVKEYAKSVNKSVSELSDFERRQAFANAVLAEGEQKFSSIKIDANPYTKLSAAIRDTTQSILEFVNKVVGPVANFFSQSPTALITGIGALAAILIKQALPAIGEFKQGLEQTAQRAGQLAQQKAQEAQQARQLINQRIIDEVESRADRELRAVEAAETRIQQLQQGNLNRRSAAFRLLSRDLQDITQQDLQRVERAAAAMERRGRTAEATAYRDVVTAIRSQITAEQDLITTRQRLTEQVERDARSWGTYGQSVRAGERAQQAATRSAIISNAAHNGSLIGVIASYRLLREEIARNNITGFSAAMLTARGAIAAVGGAISTAMNALNGFFMVIGLITAAVSLIDGIFSKASKEISGFSDAVDRTESSTKNLTNTFDAIYKTNPFSVQSMEAQANALGELSSSVDDLAKNAEKALRALESSGWDKFKNAVKGILNLDIQSSFTESLSKGIVETVKGIDNKAISEELKTKLSGILNVKDVTNLEQIEKALKGLKPTSGIVLEVQRALKGAATEAGIAASKAREFVTAFDASKDAFRELSKQFEVNDATTKWANSSIAALVSLSKNLDGPIAGSIANLVKLSEEIDKAPIFGNSSLAVAQLNTELKNAQQLMIRSEQEAQNLEKALKDLKAENVVDAANRLSGINLPQTQTGPAQKIVDRELARLDKVIKEARAARKEAESSAEAAATKIRSSINSGLTESIELVSKGLQAALAKGSTQALQSIYSRIDNIPELAGRQFDLKLKELGIQETSIRTQQELSNRIGLLTAELAVTNANAALQKAEESVRTAALGEAKEIAGANVTQAQKDLKEAANKLSLLRQAAKDPVGALATLNLQLQDAASGAKGYSKEIVDAANRNAGFIKSLQDVAAQQRVIKNLEEPLAKEAQRFKAESDALDAKLRSNATTREGLQLQLSLNKANEVETLEQLRINQLQQVDLETEKKRLQAQTAYNNSLITGTALAREGEAADAQKVYQAAELAKRESEAAIVGEERVKRGQVENNVTKERLAIYDRTQAKLKEIQDSERQNEQTRKNATLSIRDSELGLAETRLSIAEQQGVLGEEFIANARADLELAKQAVAFERERQALSDQRATAIAELAAKANRQAMANEDNSATIKQMLDLASAFDAQAVAQDRANSSRTTAIKLTREQNIELAKQNEELKKQAEILGLFESISDTLAQAFGKTGDVLGKFVKTIGEVVDSQQTYNREREKQSKIIDEVAEKADAGYLSPQDMARMNKAVEERGNLDKKNAIQELSNNAKLLGSAKTLFKEKTAAHKILAGAEKAMHIATLAMQAKELFVKLSSSAKVVGGKVAEETANTAATQAGAAARAPSYIGEIYGKTIGQLGPIAGPVVAAGLAALVLSYLGGGSAKPPPKGFTAEEQQKVQGTGQVLRGDKLVDTGAGVLGDATAKSKSVENAIQNMERYDFKNLEYSNKMLDALKAIRENTENFAGNILKAIPGINIKPETIKSGNWLFGKDTTEVVNQGIKIIGTVGQIIDETAQFFKYTNTKTSSSGLFGLDFLGGGTSYDPQQTRLVNSALQRDVSLIFKDVGTALGDAAETLGMGTATEIMNAFRSVDLSEQFKEISLMDLKPAEMVEALMSVISSGMDVAAMQLMPSLNKFRKAGESFADTVLRVSNDTRVVGLSFEELGMTLPKLAEQGAKPTIEQLNRLATAQSAYNAALAANNVERQVWVEDNAYSGTGSMQTVRGTEESARALSDALIELTSAQAAVTTASNSLTTNNIELVQSYIKAAGSLDEFVERNRFFAENFLTEAERLAPVQERVNKEVARLSPQLAQLGITAVTNRDQFKQAVFAAKALGASGVQLYNDLMKLAPAFAEVNKAMNNTTKSATELAQSLVSYLDDAFGLLNRGLNLSGELAKAKELLSGDPKTLGVNTDIADAKWISRQITMQDLAAKYAGKENEIRLKNMTNLQRWVWALEDEKQARDDYVSALQTQVTVAQKEIAKLQKAIKVYDTLLDQRAQIDKLINDSSTAAKDLARKNQLKGLLQGIEDTELQYVSAITANQEYIWALEDEQAIKDKLIKQQDKLKATIQTLEGALKSIQNYRTGLLTGDLTVLTPEQQYQEAKAAFEKVATAARTPGATEEGAALQQQAISDLPAAADKLLQMSRTLFGSSGGYQVDFKVIQDVLDLTERQVGEQLTEAQQQLKSMQEQATFLKSIDDSTQTTAEILAEYALSQDRVEKARIASSTLNIDTITNLKTSAENRIDQLSKSIEGYQDKIAELTGQSITEQQATKIATTASATYTNSIDATSRAYTELTRGIDGRQVLAALAARSEASQMISLGEQQVRLMEDTATNTAATNTNQNTQANALRTDPGSLAPVTALAPVLTVIASNTATTADMIENVEAAVVNSSQATVRTNTANTDRTNSVLEQVVQALGSAARSSTAPIFISSAPIRTSFFSSPD